MEVAAREGGGTTAVEEFTGAVDGSARRLNARSAARRFGGRR
ncbi:hypothetical protein [Umezawaea tangerina]|nr:hypothetical protein [Umezawaea tangerina]